jgi:MFS family permease
MAPSIRWLIPLCLTSALWGFSFGLSAPLASLWLQQAGYSDTVVGLNTGTYYLGIIAAAGLVPPLLRRWGSGCLLAGVIASGLTVLAFPWGGSWPGWFALRGLNGVAGAISLIPLETYINCTSTSERRAQNFGCYAFCLALGMALGTLVGMQLFAALPETAFVLGGAAPLAGAAVVFRWRPVFLTATEECRRTPLHLLDNFLSFGSAWNQGFLEGCMVGLLPIYLLAIGLSDTVVGSLMSGLMIGVIAAQVPLAWLADRLGTIRVLAACTVVALVGIGGLLLLAGTVWLALCLLVVGACSGAFYPLGLSLLGERLPAAGLARASAWYLAINCGGSVAGPVVAGTAMEYCGRGALFVTGGGAISLVFAVWLILECRRGHSFRDSRPIASAQTAPEEQDLRQAS